MDNIILSFTYNHFDGQVTSLTRQPSCNHQSNNKSESMSHAANQFKGCWCVVCAAQIEFRRHLCFYHHDLQFRCYAHLFFLSLRTKVPADAECPVGIGSLCTLYNMIGTHRLNPKHQNGMNLAFAKQLTESSGTFARQIQNWNQYQKKVWFSLGVYEKVASA